MPMDIRNFFAKKGSTTAPARAKSTSTEDSKKNSKRRSSSIKRTSSTPLSPIDEEGPSVISKKAKKKNRQTYLNSDSDEEEIVIAAKKKSKRPIEKKEDSGSDTEGEEDKAVAEEKKAAAKRKKDDSKAKTKKDVSTSDYFAASSSRRSSARKSKPRRSYVLDDSEDDDEEDDVKQKDSDEYEDDNDAAEEDDDILDADEEEQKKPASRKRSSPKAAKSPPSMPVRKPSPFKKQKKEVDDVVDITNDDDDDDKDKMDHKAETPPPSRAKNKRAAKSPPAAAKETPPSTTKKRKTQTKRGSSSSKKPPPVKKEPLIEPTLQLDSFDTDEAVSECMAGTTFVFTGVLEGISRDEGMDLVKTLGGRVTTAVSGKTSYLVVGEVLEDGRPYQDGIKYKKSMELGSVKIVKGEKQLYGLAKLYSDRAKAKLPPPATIHKENLHDVDATTKATDKKPVVNPYARKVVNPYAKKKAPADNPYAKSNGSATRVKDEDVHADEEFGPNDLWVDKYAPDSTREILGNKDSVTKLTTWLANWERKFNNDRAVGKAFSNPSGPWKAALLSGPPGIGKTTTATLVAKEAGRDTLEFNASDVRSKKVMSECFGDIIGSQSVEGFFLKEGSKKVGKKGPQKRLRCLIFDEVDGMSAGDRGGMAELIQMIKNSRVPIICICNDRGSQKMKSLLPYCMDLRFRRPIKSQIGKAAIRVAQREGLTVEQNAAESLAESCGNDIRQVINALQMWASEKQCSAMTYKGLKQRQSAINKDEILRVSLFDASKLILEGRKGLKDADAETQRANFFKRNDAFFTDYAFTGLIVQQNYLKVMNGQLSGLRRKNDDDKVLDFLDSVHTAAHTMSDYAMVENKIRGGSDMNWSLLPFSGALVVKTGFHASGPNGSFYPGFPEFTTWLGRNSSKGKKQRILQELNHHMNYKISGGTQEVRLSYLPYLRQRFYTQLKDSEDDDRNAVAIELMDDYGLDRDDVFENLDEFNLTGKGGKLGDILDSKAKAAFTREYNKGSHTSQALVAEQGAPKKNKRKGGGGNADLEDPDAINDDNFEEDDEDDESEDDMKKIRESFSKKGRKASSGKTTGLRSGKGKGRSKKK